MSSKRLQQSLKRITRLERLNLSANGNPRWRVGFDDATSAITSSDAAVGYEIGNPGLREDCLVRITWTRAGRIAYMHAAESESWNAS